MFTTITTPDFDRSIELIAKMNRASRDYFSKAFGTESFRGWLYQSEDYQGVVAVIEEESFFLVQVAFTGNPARNIVIETIHAIVNDLIGQRGGKAIYLNFYGENKALAAYFRQHGFQCDATAYQLRLEPSSHDLYRLPIDLTPYALEARTYEDDQADLYLCLIAAAFQSIDPAFDSQPNASSAQYREQSIRDLKRMDQEDNFRAFWRNRELIGLYLLTDDWIHTVAVHPRYQNQGFGSIILHHAIQRLVHEKNHPAICLNCMETNEKGLYYYRKNGFTTVGFVSEHTYFPSFV